MHKTLLFTLALTFYAAASAQSDDAAFLSRFADSFETGGLVPAKDFVPPALMSGRLHSVRPMADNDGMNNTYFVDVPDGVLEVIGTPALTVRIRELYALDYLRGLGKSEAFTKALTGAGKAKIESAAKLVSDPFATIKSAPKGASRFFGRIGEGMKGGSSATEDSTLKGILGVTTAKVKLAAQLGVSPYSTNEELQRELTNTARAMAGGGFVVNAAASAASGGAGVALTAVGASQTLTNTLENSTPDDLRLLNRQKLLALGADRALAEEFLMHPWFSPWHETITTDALATVGANPDAFLRQAVRALTTEDAFFFQRLAQILAAYHTRAAPLTSLRLEGGLITALAKDGTLLVPVSLDYGVWAERFARRAEEFTAIDQSKEHITGLALWTDGQLSERLRAELAARKIACKVNALTAVP